MRKKAGYISPMNMDCSLHDLFESAAVRQQMCRIVYRDPYGEHHAIVAVPKDWRVLDGVEWGFMVSEGGEEVEVRLADMIAIEPLTT